MNKPRAGIFPALPVLAFSTSPAQLTQIRHFGYFVKLPDWLERVIFVKLESDQCSPFFVEIERRGRVIAGTLFLSMIKPSLSFAHFLLFDQIWVLSGKEWPIVPRRAEWP